MRVITFLKKLRKHSLEKRLSKLRQFSQDCYELSNAHKDCCNTSSNSCLSKTNSLAFLHPEYNSPYTIIRQFPNSLYYSTLHAKTEHQIRVLEEKLKKL